MIRGGEGLSTYAASCKLQIERRTIPGETEAQVVRELQEIVDRLAAADSTFRAPRSSFQATVRSYFVRDPFEIARDAEIVRAVHRASTKVLARAPEYIGDTPWMDAALLQAAGIETVVIGPAGGGAHAAVEWVELESVAQIAAILAETAMDFCALAPLYHGSTWRTLQRAVSRFISTFLLGEHNPRRRMTGLTPL